MALEIKLNQKLSQTLVMTPQRQQAIKLLQLGRAEYLEVIERELLENPVLEDVREDFGPPTGTDENTPSGIAAEPPAAQPVTDENAERTKSEFESDLASYFDLYADSQGSSFGTARRYDGEDELPPIEQTVSKREGLTSHLLWQLRTAELSPNEQTIASHIIGNLDRNGYLEIPLEEIAQESNAELADAERVLTTLQAFDPVGICARDLRECLLIQLDQLGQRDSLAWKIVDRHLGKLEARRYEQVSKEEKQSLESIYEALKQIQRLEPRPGRPFVEEEPIYITPDLYVRKIESEWVVSLNEAGMPKLRLNSKYRELLSNGASKEAGDKEYLQDRLRSAAWLIKSVLQRQRTIHRVAESIMRFQREFLEVGVSVMKPLVLRDVAQDVGMHESTVSRVTTNKYIHTPHGVFELKYFFSSGLRSSEGDVSSESVKDRIRHLVSEENPADPLSDQQLAEKLKSEGIDIARRTVAKYREMMNILSSSRRKKLF
ncbi:MAG: RNA polymerase factor sigma-54 [Deltaproteobacteria bacterium]|nr:RNA polymerase factor sigma-54 [Deltaproteobacteria bacterium]